MPDTNQRDLIVFEEDKCPLRFNKLRISIGRPRGDFWSRDEFDSAAVAQTTYASGQMENRGDSYKAGLVYKIDKAKPIGKKAGK